MPSPRTERRQHEGACNAKVSELLLGSLKACNWKSKLSGSSSTEPVLNDCPIVGILWLCDSPDGPLRDESQVSNDLACFQGSSSLTWTQGEVSGTSASNAPNPSGSSAQEGRRHHAPDSSRSQDFWRLPATLWCWPLFPNRIWSPCIGHALARSMTMIKSCRIELMSTPSVRSKRLNLKMLCFTMT